MTPRSRRERPAKPALSLEGIVGTAVGIVRTEGLERVTMRRIAQELDTGAASLYVYVRSTAQLHAAVLDQLLGGVDLRPVTAVGDWRERLVEVLESYTAVLFEHPGLAQSALVARPSGERYLALVEAVLALLHEGGMPGDRAAWALDLLLQFGTATAAEHTTRDSSIDAQDEQDALDGALRRISPDKYPRISTLGAELMSGTPENRVRWGFQVLINGALHTPLPERTTP